MLMPDEIISRAVKAIERAWYMSGDAPDDETSRAFRERAEDAIRAEFTICTDWQPVEHKFERWSVRNLRTGEQYRAAARGDGTRLVTFKKKEHADLAAYKRNVLEGKPK